VKKLEQVIIVGAGFSGAMLAINLLRHDGPEATLVERAPEAGRGVAYSALVDDHILNVRASNMSAYPDDPGHFVQWLASCGKGEPTDFVSRRTYGDYLSELLSSAAQDASGRLTLVTDTAVALERRADMLRLSLASGSFVEGDAAVLAVGNLPPHDIAPIAAAGLPADVYTTNPWSPGIASGLTDEDDVLIIGTGLTMVDTAILLRAKGFGGRIFAVSRRGLLPRAHLPLGPTAGKLAEKPVALSSKLVHAVRERARRRDWRSAIDELRPYTQSIWHAASEAEQQRFIRHLRAWWDVHRHRIAPRVADQIETMRNDGSLVPVAAKIEKVVSADGKARVFIRERSEGIVRDLIVRRIINCTGPQGDLHRTKERLLLDLIARGMIRADRNRLGIDVSQQCEAISADGAAQSDLFAAGPITRGAFWEIVAVPDIRVQTWNLARRLSDAHWVEGHGL
jgi:uncharacterized NAD(P)/FAD-binding protein YdhS